MPAQEARLVQSLTLLDDALPRERVRSAAPKASVGKDFPACHAG